MTAQHRIILVHGGFVDGSGWESVYHLLRRDGLDVTVAQHATLSLESDVAAIEFLLGLEDRPAILVGHSYGGAVITDAGNHPRVAGLVYIAAFPPDAGESVQNLIEGFPPGGPLPPILPARDGLLLLDRQKFHEAFAADVDANKAAFMADSQPPWGVAALAGTVRQAAWRKKPSWYLVATEDRMVPPQAQRMMAKRAGATIAEERGSHAIMMSRPEAVADLVRTAARSHALAA